MHTRIGSLAFAVLLVAAQITLADGMFMAPEEAYGRLYGDLGATSTEQKGIIIEPAEGREVLLLQTTYHGPAAGFAWVIPVPGEPLDDDVFMASTEFIEQVLNTTEPLVKTEIETPSADGIEDPGMMAPAMEGVAGAEAEQVTLHRRMEVGDYDVSVLSATGPNVLVDWLNEHGYATPEEHASVFGHYVGKGWFFVALRVLPEVAEEKPVLNDVKPIGIAFPTERPVFPLYISRGSSREKTALTLVTLTREPVECEQLVRARLPLGDHGTGTSYARIRRETIEGQRRPSAIVEFVGYGGTVGERLHWREDGWPGEGDADPRLLWATRLWTMLDLDAMEDLSFVPGEVRAERLVITRTGKLPEPPRHGGMLLPALVLTGMVLMLLAAYRLGVHTARPAMLGIALTLLLGAGATLDRATLTSAHAGSVGGRNSGLSELDVALVRLDDAILSFLEEAGCYPATLEDLTATVPPEVGLDSSGNPVKVGRDWLGSRIKELPTDPLTGRNDTWVYEVTGSPMIDSGGLNISMAYEPTVDRDRAAELAAEATISYPLDEVNVAAAGIGDVVPLARMDIETSPGGVTIADAAEGYAAALTLRRQGDAGVVTACLSPDNRRVAFAQHYGRGHNRRVRSALRRLQRCHPQPSAAAGSPVV